jgi:NADH dehydrogenase
MILITGANGNLGRRLIGFLAGRTPVRAVVRSERAARMLDGSPGDVDVRIIDYLDQNAMTEAAVGCSHIVHLVGIIRESAGSSFQAAHEGTSRVVAEAAARAGVSNLVYLSILGASADAENACLASKGRAEAILEGGAVPALILRVPMVLGEGDYATRALYHRARRRFAFQFRAASLEQPIYAGDVLAAMSTGLGISGETRYGTYDLAGPESLSRRALTHRAAEILDVPAPRVISLPIGFGFAMAAILERLSANPPFSRAMLGVLDHDDHIDPGPALAALGLSLTSLNDALRRTLVDSPPA